jgi:hypothetical protein
MSGLEIFLYLLAAIAYFVPTYITLYRKINGIKIIFWFNLLFAWTFVAWVLLIVAALSVDNSRNPSTEKSV